MVRGKGKRYKMDRWGIKGLKTRVGREYSISRGGSRLYSAGIHVGEVRGGSRGVTSRDTVGGAAPGVRVAKSYKFGERKL